MSEARMRAALVKKFREGGVFARAVEARDTPDFPDVYAQDPITRDGFWLELKWLPKMPEPGSSARPLNGRLKVGQARWLNAHWEAGGASFVLAGVRDARTVPPVSYLLIPGRCAPALPHATFDDMLRVASLFNDATLTVRNLIDTMRVLRKAL